MSQGLDKDIIMAKIDWSKNRAIAFFMLALILILNTARCVGLEDVPNGFFADESAIAAQAVCVGENGNDIFNRPFPLFSLVLGGGYVTPVTLYSAAIWTQVFGISIGSFRAFAVFWGFLTILGIGLAVWFWTSDPLVTLFALTLASASPWLFPLSRVFWDPIVACGLFSLAMAALLFAIKRKSQIGWYVFAILISGAAYSYPTIRIQMPMIFLILTIWPPVENRAMVLKSAALAVLLGLFILPYYRDPQFLARGQMLAVWNADFLRNQDASFIQVPWIVIKNMMAHFSPSYLFLNGDSNLRHSTGFAGIWGPIEFLAIIFIGKARLRSELRIPLLLMPLIYLTGIFATSLTWESIPHALRSFACLPPLMIFVSLWVWYWSPRVSYKLAMLGILFVFSLFYLRHYFTEFRDKSAIYFDSEVVRIARGPGIRTLIGDYPEMSKAYFRFLEGQACHKSEIFKR